MKGKHKFFVFLGLCIISFGVLMYFHGARMTKCYMSGWVDLDYPISSIEYNFTTGRCPITQADGSKVYLERLLGISGVADSDSDADMQ